MVTKRVGDERVWVFPESFEYLLGSQQTDGGWQAYKCEIDGVMNTVAGLLALLRHQSNPGQIEEDMEPSIGHRILQASKALKKELNLWHVGATLHVGFEILVPKMLAMLEEYGFLFVFSEKATLLDLRDQKLARFRPEKLYQKEQTSALHSLEAFVGDIEFDKLKHHIRLGSMLASPASTAAYLMCAESWDTAAEMYLRQVIHDGPGVKSGGVPSAFPSTYFETIWVKTGIP